MSQPELYPLKFQSIFKYRIWGGDKLKTVLNKNYSDTNIGESWEVSDVSGDETLVAEGPLRGKSLKDLIATYGAAFLGQQVLDSFGSDFPLLIKFIDAKTPLSIQVHPNDELAKKRHNSFGKNEMWYIMEADEDAEIIVGFSEDVTSKGYEAHVNAGTLTTILNSEKVKSGDTFHIPTGRVHAICAGVLLAEIQQTSDITYRIFDYNRIDSKTGEKRELHTEHAKAAIDFKAHPSYKSKYRTKINTASTLVHTPYFKTNIIVLENTLERDYTAKDSFVILMCVQGRALITFNEISHTLDKGETMLLPANIDKITLSGEARMLEVSV